MPNRQVFWKIDTQAHVFPRFLAMMCNVYPVTGNSFYTMHICVAKQGLGTCTTVSGYLPDIVKNLAVMVICRRIVDDHCACWVKCTGSVQTHLQVCNNQTHYEMLCHMPTVTEPGFSVMKHAN